MNFDCQHVKYILLYQDINYTREAREIICINIRYFMRYFTCTIIHVKYVLDTTHILFNRILYIVYIMLALFRNVRFSRRYYEMEKQ